MEDLFRNEDRKLIEDLLTFSNGLIIKDSEKAEETETIQSLRKASLYMGAYFKFDKNTELNREIITKGYIDLNPYYKELDEKFGVEPAVARISNDLSILKSMNNTLDKENEKLFYDCYYECLSYYKTVTTTKAFNNQPDKKNFIKLFLIWSTIQKFLTRKMDSFFNIDVYDARSLKNSFISLGLDYFETLPIQYQRKLLKNINEIIKTKGTNKCILNIIDTFGISDACIYKYILAKGYTQIQNKDGSITTEPYLTFYKTPYDKDINAPESLKVDYNSIVGDDIYWDATESEILQEDFNTITTKYLSVDSIIDLNKDVLKLSYFLFLLKYLEDNYKDDINLSFTNTNITNNKISLFDGFITIIILVSKLTGYKDLINNNPDNINYIYGYNNIDNKLNVRELLDDIIFDLYNSNDIPNKKELIDFFDKKFSIKNFESFEKPISIEELMEVFNHNENIRKNLEDIIKSTKNKDILDKVKLLYEVNMKSKVSKSMFNNYTTFSEYIRSSNEELYSWLITDNSIMDDDEKRFYHYRDKLFEITTSISNFIYDEDLTEAINKNPFIGIDGYLQYYIQTLIALFKSYTIDILHAGFVYRIDDNMNNKFNLIDKLSKIELGGEDAEYISIQEDIKIFEGNNDFENEVIISKGEVIQKKKGE